MNIYTYHQVIQSTMINYYIYRWVNNIMKFIYLINHLYEFTGHYVPQLAELVYDRNKETTKYPLINLKGFIVCKLGLMNQLGSIYIIN